MISDPELTPWQVQKDYGLLSSGARAEEPIDPGHFSPWLGRTLADVASPARSVLFREHMAAPSAHELKLLQRPLGSRPQSRGIFGGISLDAGSEARRRQPELPTHDVENLRRRAVRRRNLEQLLE